MKLFVARLIAPVRALGRAVVFLLKVFPMLPSRPVDWVTRTPVVHRATYPTSRGHAEGDLYRPPGPGPHPAVLVCLGVVPFEVDHPQVPVLGRALARSGFATLLYWSPAMRDFRIQPEDIEDIAIAYRWLSDQPYVASARSGLLGTCVGGSLALMAAASPLIRDRVAFVSAYAPFSSMSTFARNIASSTRSSDDGQEPWEVDPLTRKVFIHSLAALLDPAEADAIRSTFSADAGPLHAAGLSRAGQSVYALLSDPTPAQAEAEIRLLPAAMQERLAMLSPIHHLENLQAPLFVLLHDVADQVIPIGESRRLVAALDNRPGLRYTEMQFQHLDPTKGHLPIFRLLREFTKFFRAMLPLFRQAVDPS